MRFCLFFGTLQSTSPQFLLATTKIVFLLVTSETRPKVERAHAFPFQVFVYVSVETPCLICRSNSTPKNRPCSLRRAWVSHTILTVVFTIDGRRCVAIFLAKRNQNDFDIVKPVI